MGYLVDTDWIIDVLHNLQPAVDTLVRLTPEGLAVSLVSYGEAYEGAYYARDREAALAGLNMFLQEKELLPLTKEVLECFAVVRGHLPRPARQQVGDMDLLIAATALTHDLTLLTRNERDFKLVPGLKLYDSSAEETS